MSDSWRLPGTFFRYLDVPGVPVTPHGYHVYHDSAISRIYPGYSPILWSRVLCQVPLFLVTVASAIKPGVLENSPCISIDRSFYLDHMPFLADLPAMFGDSSNRSIPILLLDASPMAIEFGCSASAACRVPHPSNRKLFGGISCCPWHLFAGKKSWGFTKQHGDMCMMENVDI